MDEQISEIRIVLVGKTGVGKSASGNTILGRDHFHKAASSNSVTKQCSLASSNIDGKTITVVDTPGWCDTELSEAELTQATVKCIDMSYPGPHVFLLVLTIGNRFTAEEKKAVQQIQEVFGEGATRYTMILFTRGDDLEGKSIDSYLKGAAKELQALVAKCDGRYHVFNNKDKSHNQVISLLQKIQDMVQRNGGACYTNSTYQLLEKYKKREAEIQMKADAAKKEMESREAELQRRIKLMEDEQQRQKFREAQLKEQLRKEQIDNVIGSIFMISLVEQMQEGEKEKQKALSAQAAEHEKNMDKERRQQKAEELRQRRRMEEEESMRKLEESQHRLRTERERQRFEQEKQDMAKKYKAEILKLKKQNQLAETEKQELIRKNLTKKSCIIS